MAAMATVQEVVKAFCQLGFGFGAVILFTYSTQEVSRTLRI